MNDDLTLADRGSWSWRTPIIRRRRTGTYSIVDRVSGKLIGSVQKNEPGWWVALTADGDRIPLGEGLPALYSTRRLAVQDLLRTVRGEG